MSRFWKPAGVVLTAVVCAGAGALAGQGGGRPGGPDPKEVQAVVDRAVAYFKTSQLKDGSFSPKIAGPGVAALVAASLLRNDVSPTDPLVARTLAYLEKQVQKDGGIYNKFLANYTTSVAVMAFHEANRDGKYDAL